jgi:uronate dehydrogenase
MTAGQTEQADGANEHTLLITGAAGEVGSILRGGIGTGYSRVRLSDIRPVGTLGRNEEFVHADLTSWDETRELLNGVDDVVHLGALASEAPFADILEANIRGTFHVFEGARRNSIRRVVYASSFHVTGFMPTHPVPHAEDKFEPDSFYAISKVTGEAIGKLYHHTFGLEVVIVRLGNCSADPRNQGLHIESKWLSPGDAVRLFTACLESPGVGYVTVYGMSNNSDGWWDLDLARALGYEPQDSGDSLASGVESDRSGQNTSHRANSVQGGLFVNWDDDLLFGSDLPGPQALDPRTT